MHSDFFEHEISFIGNEPLRDFVRFYFDGWCGDWFWKSGASSSGKYHPAFSQGEGGLVRHTKAVARFCEELLQMSPYAYMRNEYKDYARAACLLHDTCKYGTQYVEDYAYYKKHGRVAADAVDFAWSSFFDQGDAPELLLMAIRSHMGQWTENREDRPVTDIDRLVHMADYMASRPFIDIPEITMEYNEAVSKGANLPF